MEIALLAALLLIGVPVLTAIAAYLGERGVPKEQSERINRDSPQRALATTLAIWAFLTVIGLIGTLAYDWYPTVGSDKGEDIAHAFTLLTALAVPVGAMVIAVLVYNAFFRGSVDKPLEDGPEFTGNGPFPRGWIVATTALTLLVIIHPGLTALSKVVDNPPPDLVVKVEGVQWTWIVSYPDENVTKQPELVIPVDRTVRFEITSLDVIHSFWVPSLLMKIDALPGRTTVITLRATETGEFSSDPLVRLQCAELCGIGHASMRIPVRVLTEDEFEKWVDEHSSSAVEASAR